MVIDKIYNKYLGPDEAGRKQLLWYCLVFLFLSEYFAFCVSDTLTCINLPFFNPKKRQVNTNALKPRHVPRHVLAVLYQELLAHALLRNSRFSSFLSRLDRCCHAAFKGKKSLLMICCSEKSWLKVTCSFPNLWISALVYLGLCLDVPVIS